MAVPTDRESFKTYCLTRLGAPVINIDVVDQQVEDRVDDALKYWWDYHYDGTDMCFYKYQVTANDISNNYITLPNNIIGVRDIFDLTALFNGTDIFNVSYQFMLEIVPSFSGLSSVSMVPYYMGMQQIELIQQLLVGRQPIRFNRKNNILHIDMDWSQIAAGQYIIVVCDKVVDPNDTPSVWNDRFLQQYATALIKKQWGSNLKKYNGIQMVGGVTFNGQMIYEEADAEIKQLESDMLTKYSVWPSGMMG